MKVQFCKLRIRTSAIPADSFSVAPLCMSLSLHICHSVTPSYFRAVTLSLFHSFTLSLCHSFTLSHCHSITLSLYHSVTSLFLHTITPSLFNFFTTLAQKSLLVLLYISYIYHRKIFLCPQKA